MGPVALADAMEVKHNLGSRNAYAVMEVYTHFLALVVRTRVLKVSDGLYGPVVEVEGGIASVAQVLRCQVRLSSTAG